VDKYLASHAVRKLQLGAGTVNLPGWLNTDIEPRRDQVYLDAAGRFPIPDQSIDYIFAEQLIEHLSYEGGLTMLRECHRVLKPGGKIRLATPDLMALTAMFQEPKSDQMRQFLREKRTMHGWPEGPWPEAVIINYQFRSFGHQFVYDARTLSGRLEEAGFTSVKQFAAGETDDPELQGIDYRHNDPAWHDSNLVETMVLQAQR
jgi:predicted SAM-dependent methyltransferase